MLRKVILAAVPLLFILLISGCSDKLPIETTMSETVHDFSFTNQDQQKISLEDLKGKWWIADFVFTNCETVCLPMTSNMSYLQKQLKENNAEIQLVSFSVDPDYDTPEVLKEYGEEYDADFSSWHFLTGYDFKTIKELSIKSFRSLVNEPEYGDDQVMHGTSFYLVDPEGTVVKSYDGVKQDSMNDIVQDIIQLKDKKLLQ